MSGYFPREDSGGPYPGELEVREKIAGLRRQLEVCQAEVASLRRAEEELLRMAQEHRNRSESVEAERDALLGHCRVLLAAYDSARDSGRGVWLGEQVDAMRGTVEQVEADMKRRA